MIDVEDTIHILEALVRQRNIRSAKIIMDGELHTRINSEQRRNYLIVLSQDIEDVPKNVEVDFLHDNVANYLENRNVAADMWASPNLSTFASGYTYRENDNGENHRITVPKNFMEAVKKYGEAFEIAGRKTTVYRITGCRTSGVYPSIKTIEGPRNTLEKLSLHDDVTPENYLDVNKIRTEVRRKLIIGVEMFLSGARDDDLREYISHMSER